MRHRPGCPLVAVLPDARRLLEIAHGDDTDHWRTARRAMRCLDRMRALLRQHLEPDHELMLAIGEASRAADDLAAKASGL